MNKKKFKKIKLLFDSLKKRSLAHLSIKDQTFFVKRLSFLIKAGIPVRESLVLIREQTRNKKYISILDTVINNVSNGHNLSTSLSKFKNTFGDFAINIIDFGEQGGILSENLEYIADELQKRQALRKKIVSATIYPLLITIATLLITAFLMTYLFPKILPVFASIRMELPISTKIVIFISNFMKDYGLMGITSLTFISIAFLITLKKNPTVHFHFDKFILKLPVIGKIIQSYNMANFTRTIGLLLKSGLTMSEALTIGAKTTSNLIYQKEFKNISSVVNRGGKISEYLIKHKNLFPEIVPQLISIGEQSGNLSNSLIYLSEMHETELEDFTKNISSLIEPVLMIFMGILVGFLAISIITPIYGITQHISPR